MRISGVLILAACVKRIGVFALTMPLVAGFATDGLKQVSGAPTGDARCCHQEIFT